MISVDATALVIMVLVFALVLVLKNLFFEPLAQAMETREERIERAESAWDDAQAAIREASQQVTASVQSTRNQGYELLDKARSEAQIQARSELDRTREDAQKQIAAARERLQAETDQAARDLERQADELAAAIASRILGREVA